MHGYQLNQMLRTHVGLPITLTKSNAYKLLNDMEADGWVTHREDQKGNRPRRRVYTVTEEGRAAFERLLCENLASCPTPEFPAAVGFDFVHTLPREEVLGLLKQRREAVEARYRQFDALSDEILESHLTVSYLRHFYGGELEWLAKLVERLQAA
jgi:DNA-binding PadR family transcriptional regulator